MATSRSASWEPDWAVPPGEILQEALEEQDMSQAELARRMDRPTKTINEIIKGKAAVTPETAIQLELALGISASFWVNLESMYRQHLARQKVTSELSQQVSWVDRFPVADMIKNGLIPRRSTKSEMLEELLKFFRVSSLSAWNNQWSKVQAAYRASPAHASNPDAIAAWLRWGEIAAMEVHCEPWNKEEFRARLLEIRELTRVEPASLAIEELQDICRGVGVVVVAVPELAGTRLNGAARWLSPSKAIIQLSLRHKADDQLWFTFMHEAGHLLTSPRGSEHVDEVSDDENTSDDEQLADEFARELLVPTIDYTEFVNTGDYSPKSIQDFARATGVSAGIVVGRLQRDGHIDRTKLNHLKKRVAFIAKSWN